MVLKVVVTGAASGIGRATALRFSSDGHEVFATDRSDDKLTETLKLAQGLGGAKVHKGIGDVGVEADVQRLFTEAVEALGGEIDVLVLNAGLNYMSLIEDTPVQKFDSIFNTNVRGTFLWLKAALPVFKKRGAGQIVITNSILGEAAYMQDMGVYTSSKFAVRGLTEALRLELQGSGIKVASVCPGTTETGMTSQEVLDAAGTWLSPDDIAGPITTISYQSPRSDIEKIIVWPTTKHP